MTGSASERVRSERPGALVFRKRLLPWSETFIAAQGGALSRYAPVFVGFQREAGGSDYLAEADVLVMEEHARVPLLAKALYRATGHVPSRWLRALRSRRPAVLHAHFGHNAYDALPLTRALDLPLLVTFHGSDIAKTGSRGEARKRRRVFEEAQRIIAVSGFIERMLLEAGAPRSKVVLHHIGVDTDRFEPGPFEARSRAILFVGRLVPKKGLPHLLRAAHLVQRQLPDVELIVAGDGLERADAEQLAGELGVRCRFLGVQTPDQVAALMRRHALLCVPSVRTGSGDAEGLPMTVIEAQASGMPVVAFPSGGTAEGIVHGRTGFVAPDRDEEALADHLLELLCDDERRREFAERARRHVLEHFDLRRQTARLEALYDDVAGRA